MENKFSILLVDDIQDNIYSLKMMIEDSFDVDIYSALSAQEAMEILMKNEVDLILSDVQMPEIDGFEFAEYLKGIEKTKDIPIIFITGIYDKDEYKNKGYNLGAIEYISKPIDDALLESKLKVYIEIFQTNKQNKQEIEDKENLLMHQAKMATMGEMIGVIAHQMKQPLNILSLYCNDVKSSHELDEIDEEFIKDFDNATSQQIEFLSQTIDDFKNFFNPNKSKVTFKIDDTINKSIALIATELKNQNVNLNLTLSSEDVYGLESELEQVVLNVINNSVDAFNEKQIKDRKIDIQVASKDNYTILIMEDNALGVKEEILEKLFDPYFTTKEHGTGTGLYMVKLVIKNSFQGNLKVANTNEGLRYMIALPKTKK